MRSSRAQRAKHSKVTLLECRIVEASVVSFLQHQILGASIPWGSLSPWSDSQTEGGTQCLSLDYPASCQDSHSGPALTPLSVRSSIPWPLLGSVPLLPSGVRRNVSCFLFPMFHLSMPDPCCITSPDTTPGNDPPAVAAGSIPSWELWSPKTAEYRTPTQLPLHLSQPQGPSWLQSVSKHWL